jgi:protein required for attachment to host cells
MERLAMRQPDKMLIVIFDGEHARYVRPAQDHVLHTERRFDSAAAHKRASDLRSDRPGESFHSDSVAHHAIAPQHDPHQLEKDNFARFIAEDVNAMPPQDFETLVIAAPSASLSVILDKLSGMVKTKLVGTVAKDLTKMPDDELGSHLRDFVPPAHPPRHI